jgi:hypothetical protein
MELRLGKHILENFGLKPFSEPKTLPPAMSQNSKHQLLYKVL